MYTYLQDDVNINYGLTPRFENINNALHEFCLIGVASNAKHILQLNQ